jgi:hypothetical protein
MFLPYTLTLPVLTLSAPPPSLPLFRLHHPTTLLEVTTLSLSLLKKKRDIRELRYHPIRLNIAQVLLKV